MSAEAGTANECRNTVRGESVAVALAACYLLCVSALEVTRHAFGFPRPRDLAATPAAILAGKVWLLLTSALLVSGGRTFGVNGTVVDVLELLGLAIAAVLVVSRLGGKAFWRAAIAGHVGGTLLAYAGLGVLWLWSHDADKDVVHKLDYGVSAVWMGLLGALAVSAWETFSSNRGQRRELLLLITCAAVGLAGATLFAPLVGAEHGLAFVCGALVFALRSPQTRLRWSADRPLP